MAYKLGTDNQQSHSGGSELPDAMHTNNNKRGKSEKEFKAGDLYGFGNFCPATVTPTYCAADAIKSNCQGPAWTPK